MPMPGASVAISANFFQTLPACDTVILPQAFRVATALHASDASYATAAAACCPMQPPTCNGPLVVVWVQFRHWHSREDIHAVAEACPDMPVLVSLHQHHAPASSMQGAAHMEGLCHLASWG
jgi:hypothetical protein